MKKIISLLSVFAMIATMFTTVAFADDNNKIYWEEVEKTENSLTLKLVIETNQLIASSTGSFDLTDAISKGLTTLTGEAIEAATWNPNVSKSVIAYAYTNVDGGTGKIELGTVTFDLSTVTGDFTLPQKKAFTAKDDSKVSVIGSFTNTAVGYEVKAPTAGPVVAELEKGGEMYGMNTQVAKVTTNGAEVSKAKVTLGKEFKYYDLPAGVSGTADFIAIIRYSAELGDNPAFELSVE